MTLPAVDQAAYPTPNELRDAILRSIAFAFERRGLVANVLPESDAYIRADAFARRVSIALANNQIALQDFSPLTAEKKALSNLLKLFGVPERTASGASGYVTITTSAVVTIPDGYQATGPTGLKYTVQGVHLNVSTGSPVLLKAVTTGKATNLPAGAKFSWDSSSIGQLANLSTVAAGGLTGGADADDDEAKRRRLLERLSQPAGGGNTSQVQQWAEDASAAVARAFVFAAVRGPSSYDVTILGATGDGTLGASTCATVAAYILARMPGTHSLNVTSVALELVDISLGAVLPLPVQAGGPGGGWRDGTPFPAEDCKITAYNAGTGVATVNSTATPTAGNQIGIYDPTATNPDGTTGKMREYVVAAGVGGGVNAWTFTVTGGFASSPLGAWVSAGAVNLVQYADAAAAQFRALGPGEKTTSPDILPRGRRQPGVDVSSPSGLTSRLLDAIETAYPEIGDLLWSVRVKTGTGTGITSPDVPATTADPPNRLALQFVAFRRA